MEAENKANNVVSQNMSTRTSFLTLARLYNNLSVLMCRKYAKMISMKLDFTCIMWQYYMCTTYFNIL